MEARDQGLLIGVGCTTFKYYIAVYNIEVN
jgi:hypothetical protein